MRRPSRRQILGLCYLPALITLLDFSWRRRHGAHAHHGV